jgi:hypothetical protein
LLQEGVSPSGSYAGTSDTWLFNTVPSQPKPLDTYLRVKGGDLKSVLIRFDLQGVPPGANVVKAEMVFHVETCFDNRAQDVAAYRVLRPWSESSASWTNADQGTRWAVPGCSGVGTDRLGVPDDATVLDGYGTFRGLDVTASVRHWLQHPEENYGWLVRGEGASNAEYSLDSSRGNSLTRRPVLRVDYELCGGTSTVTPTNNPNVTPSPTSAVPTATPLPTLLSFGALQDTYIDEWTPRTSYGSLNHLHCASNGVQKMLVSFDLSMLPPGARVSSASLHLWTEPAGTPPNFGISVAAYRLLRCWEARSANWYAAATGQPWAGAGASSSADYDSQLLDAKTVSALNREYTWVVTSAVREWVENGEQNCGLVLVGQEGSQASYPFVSSEGMTVPSRPQLVVEYSVPPSATSTPTPFPRLTSTATPLPTPTQEPGTVRVLVFMDDNRNGLLDPGERGIAGVAVKLMTRPRGFLQGRSTGADGWCTFSGLDAGVYRLQEGTPEGLDSSTPDELLLLFRRILTVSYGDYNPNVGGSQTTQGAGRRGVKGDASGGMVLPSIFKPGPGAAQ